MRLDDKEIMLLWEQGVVSSNLTTPTIIEPNQLIYSRLGFFFVKSSPKIPPFSDFFPWLVLYLPKPRSAGNIADRWQYWPENISAQIAPLEKLKSIPYL